MRAECSDCRRAAEERDELTSPHDPSAKPTSDVLHSCPSSKTVGRTLVTI